MPYRPASCPEHDAIVAVIHTIRGLVNTSTGKERAGYELQEDTLFLALNQVDSIRYDVLAVPNSVVGGVPATAYIVRDRWNDNRVVNTWTTQKRADRQAEGLNAVNVAARASELADELDGRNQ